MVKFDGKEGITFNRVNVLDFWLVGFASVETEETPKDKYVGWVKEDPEDYLYNHLRVAALSMILKDSMMKMGMPQGEVYELTIAALMRSVLTFNLHKGIEQSMKLLLVCRKALKPLNLGDYEAYINDARETSIPASEKESPINAASPRLTPGVRAATIF